MTVREDPEEWWFWLSFASDADAMLEWGETERSLINQLLMSSLRATSVLNVIAEAVRAMEADEP